MSNDYQSCGPKFSGDSLVCCRTQFWNGKTVCVIVDRETQMIHFQNCYRPRWSWRFRPQSMSSCPLRDLRYVRHRNCALTITTTNGSAVIAATVTNYDVLKESLELIVPPIQGFFRDEHDVAALGSFSAFGGLAIGLYLAGLLLSGNALGVTFCFAAGGATVGIVLTMALGCCILRRKYGN